MSDPIILAVWNAIENQIAVDYSGGYSGIDLTDRVFKGRFVDQPLTSAAYIHFVDETEQNGSVLTRYQGQLRFQIYCFESGATNFDRVSKAIKLGSDVHNQLVSDRTLNLASGRIDNIVIETTALDGDRFGFNNLGLCLLEVRIDFQSDNGV